MQLLLGKHGFWIVSAAICAGIAVLGTIKLAGMFVVANVFFLAIALVVRVSEKVPVLLFGRKLDDFPKERQEKISQAAGLTAFLFGSLLVTELANYLARLELITFINPGESLGMFAVIWCFGICAGAWVWAFKSSLSPGFNYPSGSKK